MILNTGGVVLSRRDVGEADRLAVIYTEELGKVGVRFVGVRKPGRKLKALCEPLVWGEYRLYVSARSEVAKCVGGRIASSFPALRGSVARTLEGLACGELLGALTPDRSANPRKYELIVAALETLDAGASPWLRCAFGLQLLELTGFSLRGLPQQPAALWEALHETPPAELGRVAFDAAACDRFESVIEAHAEEQSGRPLKCRAVARQLLTPTAAAC